MPQKLVTRIVAKEYIPIYEMLPEHWRLESEAAGSCCQSKRPRRGLVLDIHVWVECFSVMAAILTAAYPEKAPHLFAYLRTIVRASRTFESTAWAAYDVAYRRQAANSGSLDWGVLDAGLYNDAFTGRAKAIPRCTYCLADTHQAQDCPDAPTGKQGDPVSPPQTKSARPALRPFPGTPTINSSSVEICRLFNSPGGSRCRFPQCRYAHLCQSCHAPHPAAECNGRRLPGRNRSPLPLRPADLKHPPLAAEGWQGH